MRAILLLAPVLALKLCAEEPSAETVRQQLHAKLMASLPPFQPVKQDEAKEAGAQAIFAQWPLPLPTPRGHELARGGAGETTGASSEKRPADATVVLMAPVVVAEARHDRDLDAAITRQTQAQPFSLVQGGTLYASRNGHIRAGCWWNPGQGWSFLKVSW